MQSVERWGVAGGIALVFGWVCVLGAFWAGAVGLTWWWYVFVVTGWLCALAATVCWIAWKKLGGMQ